MLWIYTCDYGLNAAADGELWPLCVHQRGGIYAPLGPAALPFHMATLRSSIPPAVPERSPCENRASARLCVPPQGPRPQGAAAAPGTWGAWEIPPGRIFLLNRDIFHTAAGAHLPNSLHNGPVSPGLPEHRPGGPAEPNQSLTDAGERVGCQILQLRPAGRPRQAGCCPGSIRHPQGGSTRAGVSCPLPGCQSRGTPLKRSLMGDSAPWCLRGQRSAGFSLCSRGA